MDNLQSAQKLFDEGLISESALEKIKLCYSNSVSSLNIELKTLLFAGVTSLAGGLGIVIYQNIDTIGHLVIIFLIAAISIGCFAYCYRNRTPYSNEKIDHPLVFFEFVLLLACLTFISFNGYLQYQYSIYGSANGASFLLPAIVLFATAYFFDNVGALSLAITSFAAFVGITIAPTVLLSGNDFSSGSIVSSGLMLGAILTLSAWYLKRLNIKKHFTFTYYNFASHLLFVSCLAGLFVFDVEIVFFLILALLVFVAFRHARAENSFYFTLIAVIYGYIGFSYCIAKMLWMIADAGILILYLALGYFIASSVYIIRFLKKSRKKIKEHADL